MVSGMRPTGSLHLGHLNGAIHNWLELQQGFESFFFVADWHALTTEYKDPSAIKASTEAMVLDWLAAGLDPDKATIFNQSSVKQHAELYLLFGMIIPVPWLERVPTYKEQRQQLENRDLSTYGFLGYPLLQAADILVYGGDRVPVGEDQLSHVELTREVARRFNRYYGEVFPEPKGLVVKAARVPGTDGRKMSKSYGNSVGLADSEEDITDRLSRMKTDTRRQRRTDPGVPEDCPVYELHEIYSSDEERKEVSEGCRSASIGCLDCKKIMIGHVLEQLRPIRERREKLAASSGLVGEVLAAGNERARQKAELTMTRVRAVMGLA